MKKTLTTLLALFLLSFCNGQKVLGGGGFGGGGFGGGGFGGGGKVLVSASEPDAQIVVDGQNLGTGTLKVKVPKDVCVNVKIQKVGFLKYEQTYCNKKGSTPPPTKQYFDMKK